jgi:hypothetical protein
MAQKIAAMACSRRNETIQATMKSPYGRPTVPQNGAGILQGNRRDFNRPSARQHRKPALNAKCWLLPERFANGTGHFRRIASYAGCASDRD